MTDKRVCSKQYWKRSAIYSDSFSLKDFDLLNTPYKNDWQIFKNSSKLEISLLGKDILSFAKIWALVQKNGVDGYLIIVTSRSIYGNWEHTTEFSNIYWNFLSNRIIKYTDVFSWYAHDGHDKRLSNTTDRFFFIEKSIFLPLMVLIQLHFVVDKYFEYISMTMLILAAIVVGVS